MGNDMDEMKYPK